MLTFALLYHSVLSRQGLSSSDCRPCSSQQRVHCAHGCCVQSHKHRE